MFRRRGSVGANVAPPGAAAAAPRSHPDPGPELVTVDIWTVPAGQIPAALLRIANGRRALRAVPGLRFAKLLGTASGRTFAARDMTPRRWAMVASWASPEQARAFAGSTLRARWDGGAREHWHAELTPLSAHGSWSGQRPFGDPVPSPAAGPVAVITRARLAWRHIPRFHRAVPAVATDLHSRDGLLLALGIGEYPVALQGTFSLWRSAAELVEFAYRNPAHQRVIAASSSQSWYAEECFARFAVLSTAGTVDGREPLPQVSGLPS